MLLFVIFTKSPRAPTITFLVMAETYSLPVTDEHKAKKYQTELKR